MARTITEKRKQFMDDLINVFDRLDPSGENSKSYQQMLDAMSDKEFDRWVREFFANEDENYYWEIEEYERDIDMKNIKNAAEYLKVPLLETVYSPYITGDPENVVMTPVPVPVGYIHIKRMQQTIMKKNKGSTTIERRDPKTGQVIGEDKNARNTDVETFFMLAMGAKNALKEFMGPRADDMTAKNQMYNSITKNGYCSLQELTNEPENKIALNTLDMYFLLQMIKTNLIYGNDLLPSAKRKKKR